MKQQESRLQIQFWQAMMAVGCILVIGGLLLVFVRPGTEGSGAVSFKLLGTEFEGSDVGLAIIALGLVCFVLGNKDRNDSAKYRAMQEKLDTTGEVVTKLVARVAHGYLNESAGQRRDDRGGNRHSGEKVEQLRNHLRFVKEQAKNRTIDYVAVQEAAKVLDLADELDAAG
jgi:hypothetical protein